MQGLFRVESRVEKRVENVDKKISVIGSDKSQLPQRLRLFFCHDVLVYGFQHMVRCVGEVVLSVFVWDVER